MNITSIIDNGYSLILEQDINTNVIIDKAQIKLELVGTIVRLYDNSTSNQANQFAQVQQYNLDFSKIINPVTPDAKTLEANISVLINTIPAPAPPPPADYSTASNQTVQITQQDDSTPFLSVFKDFGNNSVFKELTGLNQSVFTDPINATSWLRYLANLAPYTKQFVQTIDRPANVTPYTIGDALMAVVPVHITFPSGSVDGLQRLVNIVVKCSSNVAVKPLFNYFFFKAQPPIQTDNAPINVPDLFVLNELIGACNGSNMSVGIAPTVAGNSMQQLTLNPPLVMQSNNATIWVIIGLANAYIPTSGETFNFEFKFND